MTKLTRVFRIDEGWVQNPGSFKKPGWGEPSGGLNKFEPGIDIETPSHTKAGVQDNLKKAQAALNFAVAQKQSESVIKKYEEKVEHYAKLAASVKESSLLSFANNKLNLQEIQESAGHTVPTGDKHYCVIGDDVNEGINEEQFKFTILTFLTGDSHPMKEFTVVARSDREAKILAKKKLADRGVTNIRSLNIQASVPVKEGVDDKERYHSLYPHVPLDQHSDHEYNKLSDRDLQAKKEHQTELGRKLGTKGALELASIAKSIQINREREIYDGNAKAKRAQLDARYAKDAERLKRKKEAASDGLGEGTGLSPKTLTSYKAKAGEYATAADKAADIMRKSGDQDTAKRWTERANKKYSGITKATFKQFNNDAKGLKEEQLNEDLKQKIIVTALALLSAFTPLAQAQTSMERQFDTVTKDQIVKYTTLTQKALKAETADYRQKHDIPADKPLDQFQTKFVAAKAQERVSAYLKSETIQAKPTANKFPSVGSERKVSSDFHKF